MAYDGHGTVYIPLADFIKFLNKYTPDFHKDMAEYIFDIDNVRHINPDELEVDYAFSTTEVHPLDWASAPHWIKKIVERKQK
jgi:hypothetical protein